MGTGTQNDTLGEPMQIRLAVKNTFIDADDDELDNDSFEKALRRMVSEPVPVRQYSGNAGLAHHNISVVPEEEVAAEQDTCPSSSTAPQASSAAAVESVKEKQKISVKNTFIDVDEPDDGFEAGLQEILRARQQSEPVFQRQMSALSQQLQAAVSDEMQNQDAIDAMLDVMNLRKELPAEEPETEIEPQMQAAEQEWVNYFQQPDGLMNFGGAFTHPNMMFQQQEHQEFYPGMQDWTDPKAAAARVVADGPPVPAEWANVYTVMMRNLPNRYTQRMLLDEICSGGFMGTFDFLYLPIDPDTNANKGYGFINFLDPSSAWHFKCTYEGKQMSRFNSSKFVSVSPAALQGLEANHAHYSTSRCSRGDPAARPLFLREPQQNMGARSAGRQSRRGGRRRLQDVSLVDIAARNARQQQQQGPQPQEQQPQGKGEAKPVPSGQLFGLGGKAAPGKGGGKGAAKNGGTEEEAPKFCPFCGGACKPAFRFCQFCGANLDVLRTL